MEYLIHTYGGGNELVAVLNAVAMIFKSDSTYLTPVGTMALTLGGVYAAIKGLLKIDISFIGRDWLVPSLIIFTLLFAPKSTVWVKDNTAGTAPVKIDNIPIGISVFAHVSTTVVHHLCELIEETMLPVGVGRAESGGILYGAKAAGKIRDIQIHDRTLLRNTKEYLRQCYMKPIVMGNFGGRREEAIRKNDLLEYLIQNPTKCFGIKPVNPDGTVGQFMTCTEAGKMIKKGVVAESKDPNLLKQFASIMGIRGDDEVLMAKRIKSMTANTFRYLEQGTADVHEWMKQAMILNANRESYDDWREKVGHSRAFPDLVTMQATRGLYQQSMGAIVGGEMSKALIPAAAHPTMLALVIMLFVVVLPLSLLPGGWNYITTSVKLLIWVASWPVFYTIVHCIEMIQLKDSIGGWTDGGLSHIGQAGFSQILLMKYASTQSLISAVPVISFAIVFASPYALSGIAAGIASVGSALGIGSSMADGNISMGQVQNNNISKGQHNLAPSLSMGGGVIDDGAMRIMTSHDGQSSIVTEHVDQLASNVSSSENVVATTNESLTSAQSNMAGLTDRQSQMTSVTKGNSIDLAKSYANGTATAEGLSLSSQESLRNGFTNTSSGTTRDSLSESQSTGTHTSISAGTPGGLSALTGASASTGVNANNNLEYRTDMTKEEQQAFNTALEELQTAVKDDRITTTNSEDTRLAESLKSDLITQDQIAKDIAKTQQDIDTYTNQVNYAKSNSGAINRNLNEPFLNEIIARNPEINSKEQALTWARSHKSEADAIAKDVIAQNNPFETAEYKTWVANVKSNAPDVKNIQIASAESLETKYKETSATVQEQAVVKDATGEQKRIKKVVENAANNSNLEYNKDVGEVLRNNLFPDMKTKLQELDKEKNKEKGSKTQEREAEIKEAKLKSKQATGNYTGLRVLEKVGNNTTEVLQDLGIEDKKENKGNKK